MSAAQRNVYAMMTKPTQLATRHCTKVLRQHHEWQQVYATINLQRMPKSYGLVLKYGVTKKEILFGNSIIYSFEEQNNLPLSISISIGR
jgi:hypothetical protein